MNLDLKKEKVKPKKTRFVFGRDMSPEEMLDAVIRMAKENDIPFVDDRKERGIPIVDSREKKPPKKRAKKKVKD